MNNKVKHTLVHYWAFLDDGAMTKYFLSLSWADNSGHKCMQVQKKRIKPEKDQYCALEL